MCADWFLVYLAFSAVIGGVVLVTLLAAAGFGYGVSYNREHINSLERVAENALRQNAALKIALTAKEATGEGKQACKVILAALDAEPVESIQEAV